jgi:GNAT superfamily N-acetyltransferase
MATSTLRITTDRAALDVALIHRFLTEQSTWAKGIPYETVARSLEHSLCFGGFLGASQVAFARVISDYATFANLVDVFVLPAHRGRGFSRSMMDAVLGHPSLQGLRRFTLATTTARGLYEKYGFTPLSRADAFMERYIPDIYERAS